MRVGVAGGSWVVGLVAGLMFACSSTPAPSLWQPEDLQNHGTNPFSASSLIEADGDFETSYVTEKQVQRFFEKTPYSGRPSFLATYSSNGVSASSAVMLAASAYRVSATAFLVELQVTQGLVGERYYPSDSKRVEYAFGCGCNGRGTCEAAFAGLDRQLMCLGAEYRKALDAMAGGNAAVGGWKPGDGKTTLDGIKVTPANPATAAIYSRRPFVYEKQGGGSWLYWNLWNYYSDSSDLFR